MNTVNGSNRIRVKRVYDPPSPDDGVRILVDRLWPREAYPGRKRPLTRG